MAVDLYNILRDARQRVILFTGKDQGVVERSQETVDLVLERLRAERMSEDDLRNLARSRR